MYIPSESSLPITGVHHEVRSDRFCCRCIVAHVRRVRRNLSLARKKGRHWRHSPSPVRESKVARPGLSANLTRPRKGAAPPPCQRTEFKRPGIHPWRCYQSIHSIGHGGRDRSLAVLYDSSEPPA